MTKKDDTSDKTPKKVLATGASGDPEHPEVGAPASAASYFQSAPVTDTTTQAEPDQSETTKDEDTK